MIDYSFIIPVYNLEKYIEKSLESICNNSDDNVEIIIIDDGSSDSSKRIAEHVLSNSGTRHYTILEQKNSGVSVARNLGIQKASGNYLIFCDGDDFCANNMIKQIEGIKNGNYDIIAWRYDILQGKERVIASVEFKEAELTNQKAFKAFLLNEYKIRLGSFAVKKSLLDKNRVFFTNNCAIGEDVEFIYKCLSVAQSVRVINDVLYTYVKRIGSAMNTFDLRRFEAPDAIRRIYNYVEKHTMLLEDIEIENYLQNGFYVLHSMYSLDACIKHLKTWREIVQFKKIYIGKYKELDDRIKRAHKAMKIFPNTVSRRKLFLFGVSRNVYIFLYGCKELERKGFRK